MVSRKPRSKKVARNVVVILPFMGKRVLMQLRDSSAHEFSWHWGYFGGAINRGEKPAEAAKRELLEEIGYDAHFLYDLGSIKLQDIDSLISHAFTCRLDKSLEHLILSEGADWVLATLDEVRSGQLFSQKLGKFFPIANTMYIPQTLEKALAINSDNFS